jgi:hypothetical protein
VNIDALQPDKQSRLIEYLRKALERTRAFIDLARSRLEQDDHEGYARVLRKTRRAIDTVHRFEEKIQDPNIRKEIELELEEIEKRLFADRD